MKPQPSQLSSTALCSLSGAEPSKTKLPRRFTFGQKITETVKGKLSLGAKIVRAGGVGNVFQASFGAKDGEKLVKTWQCCLSTTAGPIGGLLFISTERVCFYSERSFKLRRVFSSNNGKPVTVRYKVTIPLSKIKCANERRDAKKPTKKYVQVMTEDKFEFWFMGFIHHNTTLRYLQEAIISSSQNQCHLNYNALSQTSE